MAYDDGALEGEWGSDGIDDEGTPTQRTTVIEDGKLASYLYDLIRARSRRRGVDRQRPPPVLSPPARPRMTNTYFAPGDATPEELIAGVERGLYAVSFGGGQVEPATGDFVFGVSEGYLIEGGKVTAPGARGDAGGQRARGAGGDRRHRRPTSSIATGYCGKAGQRVAAGVGQPHVHIRELTVGGTGVSDLEALARSGVEAALAAGAGEAEAWCEESTSRQIRVYDGAVESLSDAGGRGIGIRAFIDGRSATPTAPT